MSPKTVASKAPGKIILHGEHSVVYGKPAFAVSADLWTRVTITERSDGVLSADLGLVNLKQEWQCSDLKSVTLMKESERGQVIDFSDSVVKTLEDLVTRIPEEVPHGRSATSAFLIMYLAISDSYKNGCRPALNVTVESDLPSGGGLGSSSAFAVSCVGALLKFYDIEVDLEVVNKWAYQIDRLFHGKPSGIDNSICTYGGGLFFEKGQIKEKMSLESANLDVILVSTKVTRNTKNQVAKAAKLIEAYPAVFQPILDAMGGIVNTAWNALKETPTNYDLLETMIDTNQLLLESLNATHSTIEQILKVGAKFSIKGKLTGAGGGGCVFLLLKPETIPKADSVIDELKSLGFQCWRIKFGVAGLTFL